jgi:hypothetical protein
MEVLFVVIYRNPFGDFSREEARILLGRRAR